MIDHDRTSKISCNFYSIMIFSGRPHERYDCNTIFWAHFGGLKQHVECWVNYELIGPLPKVAKIWGTSGVCETIASLLQKFYPPAITHSLWSIQRFVGVSRTGLWSPDVLSHCQIFEIWEMETEIWWFGNIRTLPFQLWAFLGSPLSISESRVR